MAQPTRILVHGARVWHSLPAFGSGARAWHSLPASWLIDRVHENFRCLDDPPHPKLDLWQLYRCNRRIHQKPSFLFVKLLLPQFTPEKP